MYREVFKIYSKKENMDEFKELYSSLEEGTFVGIYHYPPEYYYSYRIAYAKLAFEMYFVWRE